MKTLFWIWFAISSTTTVTVFAKYVAWEMRDAVPPDSEGISKKLEYAIQARNTETVFQHTFSTEITGDSDLFRITDSNIGSTPQLSFDAAGTMSIGATSEDITPDTASIEAFAILCHAAGDYRNGHRNDAFDSWVDEIVSGSDPSVFHDGTFTAIVRRTEHAITVTVFAH